MINQDGNQFSVKVSKDIPAPIDQVFFYFEAHPFWEKWWIHTFEVYDGMENKDGKFSIICENIREDVMYTVSGAVTLVKPNKSMVIDWKIEQPDAPPHQTIVNVDFDKSFVGTSGVIRHTGFMSYDAAALHDESWLGGLHKACYFIMRM